MHNNKRFAFGVLDNEDSSRDVIPSKAGFISRRGVDNNGDEVDDDRQALIPRTNGELRSADNEGRRLSRDDDLNEVSTEGGVNGMNRDLVCRKGFYRFLKLYTCHCSSAHVELAFVAWTRKRIQMGRLTLLRQCFLDWVPSICCSMKHRTTASLDIVH